MTDSMHIDAIVVGERHRKDLGDLSDLVESVKDVGVIQPVGVDQDGKLLFGERRLAACRLAGLTEVPVHVIADFDSAVKRLTVERDENTCRKDMTPEELVRLGLELEELERPRAKERKESSQFGSDGGGLETSTAPGKTYDIVGGALGKSGATYKRAKAVVLAAGDDDAPAPVREAAQEALVKMNAGGSILSAYNKVRDAKKQAEPDREAPASDAPKDRARSPRLHHKRAAKLLPRFLSQIGGIAAAVDGVDFSDCQLQPHEIRALDADFRILAAVRKTLRGNLQ